MFIELFHAWTSNVGHGGRPPEQLPIGGYEKSTERESVQTPVQSLVPLKTPRQLPLTFIREFKPDVVMQRGNDAGNDLPVQQLLSAR